MGRSPGTARLINKHFEALSWVFTIILFVSIVLTAFSAYNIVVYGTCDPANPDQCIIGIEPICGGGEACQPCQCNTLTCDSPDYIACEGDCQCEKEVCEGS